jgi:hypothetical protein
MDDPVKLRSELADLNEKCQQARDLEVRYALQRSRLEAERASLLVRLVETTVMTAAPVVPILASAPVAPPYRVTWQTPTPVPDTVFAAVAEPAISSHRRTPQAQA